MTESGSEADSMKDMLHQILEQGMAVKRELKAQSLRIAKQEEELEFLKKGTSRQPGEKGNLGKNLSSLAAIRPHVGEN
eukprot:12418343-Karenia_brevis.AAC.1